MTRYLLPIALLFQCCAFAHAQSPDPRAFDYSAADSIALHFPDKRYKSIAEIVPGLTDSLTTDPERFRAIFMWIANNIDYSYSNRSCDTKQALKKRKAVCIGYSTLLHRMCGLAGIETVIIRGYARPSAERIHKKMKETTHAWNAVKLYDQWFLTDITWASGYYDDEEHEYVREFDENYFLTEPARLVTDHLPKEPQWQLLDNPVSKREFSNSQLRQYGYYDLGLRSILPVKGIQKIRLKDSLEVTLSTNTEIIQASIITKRKSPAHRMTIQQVDDNVILRYKFNKPGEYNTTVIVNGEAVVCYKVKVR